MQAQAPRSPLHTLPAGSSSALSKPTYHGRGFAPPHQATSTSGASTAVVTVPCDCVRFIIGKGGANISALRASTGCSITIQDAAPDSKVQQVRVRGPDDAAVAAAVAALQAKVASCRAPGDGPGRRADGPARRDGSTAGLATTQATQLLRVHCALITGSAIVGKRGAPSPSDLAPAIRSELGVVVVPRPLASDAVNQDLVVTGPDAASVAAAVDRIQAFVREAYSVALAAMRPNRKVG